MNNQSIRVRSSPMPRAVVALACLLFGALAGVSTSRAAARGTAAPASASTSASEDAALGLAQYRGRVVVVEFWASWCAPCRDSIPWLGAMLSDYAQSGLVVIAVNVDQNRAAADQFLSTVGGRDLNPRYDPNGEIASRLNIGGMPTEVIFDRNGVERFRHSEFLLKKRNQYESELRSLLDEK